MRTRPRRIAACLAVLVAVCAPPAVADKAKAAAPSLYERIGGARALEAVVADFVVAAAADPRVDFTRGGAWHASDAAVARLRTLLVEFMGQAFGGPQTYSGRSMKETHHGMAITRAQFDALAGHLKATLEKHKVPAKEIGEIMTIAASTAPDVVEKP